MADLTFTTIEEAARHTLNISRDEYAVCNYVQTWAAHPSNKTPGFCNRTRGQMALFVGISERGMQKMLIRLEGMDLIKRASQSQFLYRITERWFDIVVAAKEQRTGEQGSRQGVNKVPGMGEQSSRHGVNKVPTHKECNKEVNKQQKKAKIDVAVFDPEVNALIIDSIPLEEKKKNPSPVPPPPSQPAESFARRYDAFDIDVDAARLKEDQLCRDRFGRDLHINLEKANADFPRFVDEFVTDQKTTTFNYQSTKDFRAHFFNWILKAPKAKQAANASKEGNPTRNAQQTPPPNYQTQTRH